MWHEYGNRKIQGLRVGLAIPLALLFSLAACNRMDKVAEEARNTSGEQTLQKTFASPDDAANAFFAAAKAGDRRALAKLFGPEGGKALFTGDGAKDEENLRDFAAAYTQMHRWSKIKAGGQVLYIGADNYAFPIPLAQNTSGQWFFDTPAGKDEILARRVGAGERTAIAAGQALAGAEQRYFTEADADGKVKQYARKFGSDPGKRNGLYWPIENAQPLSPLGRFGTFAKALDGEDGPQRFKGYDYRILTRQGDKAKGGARDYMADGKLTRGFAILAYPTEYRESGIMSFIVGADGIVYQKDLGENTARLAAAMTEYNPGDGWSPALPPEVLPTRKHGGTAAPAGA
jgi:hypothetical protein